MIDLFTFAYLFVPQKKEKETYFVNVRSTLINLYKAKLARSRK